MHEDKIKNAEALIEKEGHVNLFVSFDISKPEAEQIISIMSSTGKYMLDKTPFDGHWIMRKNPNYELSESVRKTNNIQKVILIITGALALFTSGVAFLDFKKDSKVVIILQQPESKDTLTITKDTTIVTATRHYSKPLQEKK